MPVTAEPKIEDISENTTTTMDSSPPPLDTVMMINAATKIQSIERGRQSRKTSRLVVALSNDEVNEINQRLVVAVQNNDLKEAILALKAGADPNRRISNGCMKTVLHIAVADDQWHMTNLLLNNMADPTLQDSAGFTSLIIASGKAYNGPIISSILENCSSESFINNCTMRGDSALIMAAVNDAQYNLDLLIKKGARINLRNDRGRTALIEAAISHNSSIVKSLLDAGANTTIKDHYGRTFKKIIEAHEFSNVPSLKDTFKTYDTFKQNMWSKLESNENSKEDIEKACILIQTRFRIATAISRVVQKRRNH